ATIAKFNQQGKLASIHKYWDQGSVLRQLGILPLALYCKANSSETVLPILGSKIIDRLEDPYNSAANVLLKESVQKAAGFAGVPAQVNNSYKPITSIVPQGDIQPHKGRQHKISNILPSDQPVEVVRSSTRVFQAPGGRSNIFDMATEPLPTVKTSVPIDPRRNQSQITFVDDTAPVPVEMAKVSSRSRRNPNWSSLDEHEEVKEKKPVAGTFKNESNWSLSDTTSEPVHYGKRMGPVHINESQFSIGYEAPVIKTQQELVSEDVEYAEVEKYEKVEEQNVEEFVEEKVIEEKVIEERIPSKSVIAPFTSYPSSDEIVRKGLKDRNAQSSTPQPIRSSNRVLGPPGGKSTIFFG
ncbi:hypothetical protein HK096_001164, partial [Nowakowskiella sp. JEL0078]